MKKVKNGEAEDSYSKGVSNDSRKGHNAVD